MPWNEILRVQKNKENSPHCTPHVHAINTKEKYISNK